MSEQTKEALSTPTSPTAALSTYSDCSGEPALSTLVSAASPFPPPSSPFPSPPSLSPISSNGAGEPAPAARSPPSPPPNINRSGRVSSPEYTAPTEPAGPTESPAATAVEVESCLASKREVKRRPYTRQQQQQHKSASIGRRQWKLYRRRITSSPIPPSPSSSPFSFPFAILPPHQSTPSARARRSRKRQFQRARPGQNRRTHHGGPARRRKRAERHARRLFDGVWRQEVGCELFWRAGRQARDKDSDVRDWIMWRMWREWGVVLERVGWKTTWMLWLESVGSDGTSTPTSTPSPTSRPTFSILVKHLIGCTLMIDDINIETTIEEINNRVNQHPLVHFPLVGVPLWNGGRKLSPSVTLGAAGIEPLSTLEQRFPDPLPGGARNTEGGLDSPPSVTAKCDGGCCKGADGDVYAKFYTDTSKPPQHFRNGVEVDVDAEAAQLGFTGHRLPIFYGLLNRVLSNFDGYLLWTNRLDDRRRFTKERRERGWSLEDAERELRDRFSDFHGEFHFLRMLKEDWRFQHRRAAVLEDPKLEIALAVGLLAQCRQANDLSLMDWHEETKSPTAALAQALIKTMHNIDKSVFAFAWDVFETCCYPTLHALERMTRNGHDVDDPPQSTYMIASAGLGIQDFIDILRIDYKLDVRQIIGSSNVALQALGVLKAHKANPSASLLPHPHIPNLLIVPCSHLHLARTHPLLSHRALLMWKVFSAFYFFSRHPRGRWIALFRLLLAQFNARFAPDDYHAFWNELGVRDGEDEATFCARLAHRERIAMQAASRGMGRGKREGKTKGSKVPRNPGPSNSLTLGQYMAPFSFASPVYAEELRLAKIASSPSPLVSAVTADKGAIENDAPAQAPVTAKTYIPAASSSYRTFFPSVDYLSQLPDGHAKEQRLELEAKLNAERPTNSAHWWSKHPEAKRPRAVSKNSDSGSVKRRRVLKEPRKCTLCDRVFKRPGCIPAHLIWHARAVCCSYCKQAYTTARQRDKHQQRCLLRFQKRSAQLREAEDAAGHQAEDAARVPSSLNAIKIPRRAAPTPLAAQGQTPAAPKNKPSVSDKAVRILTSPIDSPSASTTLSESSSSGRNRYDAYILVDRSVQNPTSNFSTVYRVVTPIERHITVSTSGDHKAYTLFELPEDSRRVRSSTKFRALESSSSFEWSSVEVWDRDREVDSDLSICRLPRRSFEPAPTAVVGSGDWWRSQVCVGVHPRISKDSIATQDYKGAIGKKPRGKILDHFASCDIGRRSPALTQFAQVSKRIEA